MIWTRTDTLPVADYNCASCYGLGLKGGSLEATQPCNCVLRSIFRAVYERFRIATAKEKSLSRVTLDNMGAHTRRKTWGRKDEELHRERADIADHRRRVARRHANA